MQQKSREFLPPTFLSLSKNLLATVVVSFTYSLHKHFIVFSAKFYFILGQETLLSLQNLT